jgi:hypothetical protein
LQEDVFEREAERAEFIESPSGLDHGAGDIAAHVLALHAFDFETVDALLGIFCDYTADAGETLENDENFSGRDRRDDLDTDRLGSAQTVGEVGDSIGRHDLAAADDDDLAAGVFDFGEDVRGEDDGVVAGEGGDEFAGLDDLFGVEAGGGFIENQDLGVMDNGLGETDALAVAF